MNKLPRTFYEQSLNIVIRISRLFSWAPVTDSEIQNLLRCFIEQTVGLPTPTLKSANRPRESRSQPLSVRGVDRPCKNSSCLESAWRKAEIPSVARRVRFTSKFMAPNRSPSRCFSRPITREAKDSGQLEDLVSGNLSAALTAIELVFSSMNVFWKKI